MKKVLLLLATVMTAMSLWAAPVNLSTAKAKAQNYLVKEMYAGRIMSPAALEPVLLKAEMGLLNQPVFYIFNTESTFIVVAGDDRADEILMIGDRPLRNIDNLPLGLRDMLGQYKDISTSTIEGYDFLSLRISSSSLSTASASGIFFSTHSLAR